MKTTKLPLCINCKWMGRDCDDNTPLCKRPGQGSKNFVTGGLLLDTCQRQRKDHDWLEMLFFGRTCGEKAKYFQPKEQP